MRLVLLALASTVLLSGCMLFETRADRALRQQPNFRAGYEDGCASANAEGANMRRGNVVRDDALYDSDKAYRVGWANGHMACSPQVAGGQARGPLQDVNPGGGH